MLFSRIFSWCIYATNTMIENKLGVYKMSNNKISQIKQLENEQKELEEISKKIHHFNGQLSQLNKDCEKFVNEFDDVTKKYHASIQKQIDALQKSKWQKFLGVLREWEISLKSGFNKQQFPETQQTQSQNTTRSDKGIIKIALISFLISLAYAFILYNFSNYIRTGDVYRIPLINNVLSWTLFFILLMVVMFFFCYNLYNNNSENRNIIEEYFECIYVWSAVFHALYMFAYNNFLGSFWLCFTHKYEMNFFLWLIPQNIILLAIVLKGIYIKLFKESKLEENNHLNRLLLILMSFISLSLSIFYSNQQISLIFGLPTSDLPVTTAFSVGVNIVRFLLLFIFIIYVILFFIHLHEYITNKKSKILLMIFLLLSVLESNFIIAKMLLNDGKNENYTFLFMKRVAYEYDFQHMPKYFEKMEIKNSYIKELLYGVKTVKVRLHENGHISLMCTKGESKILSNNIHIFKYDDLEKESYQVFTEIIRDCKKFEKSAKL